MTVAAVGIGDGCVHSTQPVPDTAHVDIIVRYLSRVRNSRLARVRNTADSTGNRNPPRLIVTRFVEDRRCACLQASGDGPCISFAQSLKRI